MATVRPWHRKLRYRVALAIAVSVALAIAGAAWFSLSYWGYLFAPRAMDERINRVDRVTTYAEVAVGDDGQLVAYEGYTPPPVLPRSSDPSYLREPYYLPTVRIEESLEARGLLHRDLPRVSNERVRPVPQLMKEAGVAVPDSPGYDHLLTGRTKATFIEATTTDGEQLLIAIYSGGEVSNDHLPHYELVFDRSVTPMRLLSSRQWYFDVAGIEGMTFERVAIALTILSQLITLPIVAVVVLVRRFTAGAHMRAGKCPKCKHDLLGDFQSGCTECGWRKEADVNEPADPAYYAAHRSLLRRIMRPRSVFTATLALLASAACWWAHSLPGGIPLLTVGLPRVLVVALSIIVIKLALGFFRPQPHMSTRASTWLIVLICIGGGTLAVLPSRLPLHVRFRLSESALNERADRAALMPGAVGLYRIRRVSPTTDSAGTIVWLGTPDVGQTERPALVYFRHKPDISLQYVRGMELRHLRGNWYLFEYR